MQNKEFLSVRRLCIMAMLCALSVVLTAFIHFPIFPSAAFLEYDPADIPIFIGTFLFGPLSGLFITVVTSVIQGVTVSAASGWIGIVMHVAATGAFVLVFGGVTHRRRTVKSQILGLSLGVLTMTLLMVVMNLIFTPLFMGAPVEVVMALLLPAIIPFNLIKSVVNAAVAFGLFRVLGLTLKKGNIGADRS